MLPPLPPLVVVVTAMAASGAMEGAGSGSVNAKRSSRCDAAREAQGPSDATPKTFPRNDTSDREETRPNAIPRRVLVTVNVGGADSACARARALVCACV